MGDVKLKKPTIREIIPKVYFLTYDTRYNLCMSFVRIQEFYESPFYKGKYFTLEDFMDYWSLEFGNGSFDYTSSWDGFNFSGNVLNKWIQLFSRAPLREKENAILTTMINKIKYWEDLNDIYIIATHKENTAKRRKEIVEHELAHAMYCLYPKYKKSCDKLIEKLKSTEWGMVKYSQTKIKLNDMGYCDDVADDEMQAYWSTSNPKDSLFEKLKLDPEASKITELDFVKNFNTFKDSVKTNEVKNGTNGV